MGDKAKAISQEGIGRKGKLSPQKRRGEDFSFLYSFSPIGFKKGGKLEKVLTLTGKRGATGRG